MNTGLKFDTVLADIETARKRLGYAEQANNETSRNAYAHISRAYSELARVQLLGLMFIERYPDMMSVEKQKQKVKDLVHDLIDQVEVLEGVIVDFAYDFPDVDRWVDDVKNYSQRARTMAHNIEEELEDDDVN